RAVGAGHAAARVDPRADGVDAAPIDARLAARAVDRRETFRRTEPGPTNEGTRALRGVDAGLSARRRSIAGGNGEGAVDELVQVRAGAGDAELPRNAVAI